MKILAEELRSFCVNCFNRMNVPKEQVEILADHLILANLRGVDSHGVIRIPFYIEGIRKGLIKARADIRIIRDLQNYALIDGGMGLGIVVANTATDIAISKAKGGSIGIVGAWNLGHVGMLAYYTSKIAEEKLIGFSCANSPAGVVPWGGKERVFGTNPLSISFPKDNGPIVLDMATSTMASFKILVMMLKGEKLPEGAALDKYGKPTTDPGEALRGFLLPFGGYKGYGLSLTVEILASAFVGGPSSKDITPSAATQGGFLVVALDPTMFRGYEEYEADVNRLIDIIKASPPAEGFTEVLLPGEPEELRYQIRSKQGVPLDCKTWDRLQNVANELGVQLPKPV